MLLHIKLAQLLTALCWIKSSKFYYTTSEHESTKNLIFCVCLFDLILR